jgi:phosphate transport system permease protein
MARSRRLYIRRRWRNVRALGLSYVATMIGLFFLGTVLWTLLQNGLPALDIHVLTEMTPPPNEKGGLLNAIVGSLMMTGLGTLIGTPIGILAGTYLAEYGENSWLAAVIRFTNGILLSAPSIVIGFFIYTIVVTKVHHFSAFAGALALTLVLIPIVISNTENMLRLIPHSLREAAAALGAPRWKVITMITYRSARAGILTGILLAIARVSGETAPLLFTALNNQFFTTDLQKPMANLPSVIFQFAMSPYQDWRALAWAGALLITAAVLGLNILARIFLRAKT